MYRIGASHISLVQLLMTGEREEDIKAKVIKLAREGVPPDRIAQTILLPLTWVKELIEADRFAERAERDAEYTKNQ